MLVSRTVWMGLALVASLSLGRANFWGQEFESRLIETDLVEDGQPIRLELVFAKPEGEGPFPTFVFNHGSTGNGSNPDEFTKTIVYVGITQYFNERGWLVVFPFRRGRGRSDGLYDEGFTLDRSGYSCDPSLSLPGVERAMEDLDEVVKHLVGNPLVRPKDMVIGGQSRGGILSVAYAGTRPDVFRGVVNFVGGWMGDSCPNPGAINTVTFERGATYPNEVLWLYGYSDPFYSTAHSLANFDAFVAAGGNGDFHIYTPEPGYNGHGILFTPDLWAADLEAYLERLPAAPKPLSPKISDIRFEHPDRLRVSFATEQGFRYQIYGGDSPESDQWQFFGEAILADGSESQFEVAMGAGSPKFFVVRAD